MHTIRIWTKEKGYQALERTPENLAMIDEQDHLKCAQEVAERATEISLQQAFLPQYLLGIDVSKWQGVMNWQTAVSKGINFSFVRAGFAGSSPGVYEDSQFERNSIQAPLYLATGFYWFFRGTTDPIIQADFFCDLIQTKLWEIRPVVDVEVSENMTPHSLRLTVEKFINRVYARLQVKPQIIYTRSTFWNVQVEDSTLWEQQEVWIARYDSTLTHPWGDNQCKPRDWNDWSFWQFSSTGDGLFYGAESLSLDMDYFNGTMEDFKEYLDREEPPPPEHIVVETYQLIVLAGVLNIRSSPSTTATVKGTLYAGEKPCEFEEIKKADGSLWSRIGWKQYACKKGTSGVIYMEYTHNV